MRLSVPSASEQYDESQFRMVIVDGLYLDDVVLVKKTNEQQELRDARRMFGRIHPTANVVKTMTRVMTKDEEDG